MMGNKEAQWFVFYTVSRHEKKVEESLIKQGLESFLPLIEVMKQWSDRKKKVKEPLFKGYIFVKTTASRIPLILSTNGIVGTVKFESGYGTITQKEIDQINKMLNSGYFAEAVPAHFAEGDEIIMKDGPLKGIKGKYINKAGKDFIYILIASVNQSIKVKIPAFLVKKINADEQVRDF